MRGVVECILYINNPCAGSWSVYSILLISVQGRGVYTPYCYSLYGVVEFILHIVTPCTGSWSLYSTLIILVLGRGFILKGHVKKHLVSCRGH